MIEIDGKIVSTDIITEKFLCDLSACKGICCVEGNAGAPLELRITNYELRNNHRPSLASATQQRAGKGEGDNYELREELNEAEILEKEFPNYKPFMTAAGIAEVERQGFAVVDGDGDLVTPLVGDAGRNADGECAYSYRDGNGVTLCAIEKAFNEGLTTFRKPISCHLYPIRVAKFGDGSLGLNYHRWAVCEGARELGRAKGVPMYRMLREAIVRRFGTEFYEALEAAEKWLAVNG
jgi:hypothetical protein